MTPAELRAKLVERMARAEWTCIVGRGHASDPSASEWSTSVAVASAGLTAIAAFLAENGLKIVPAEATEKIEAAAYNGTHDDGFRDMYGHAVAAFPDILKEPL